MRTLTKLWVALVVAGTLAGAVVGLEASPAAESVNHAASSSIEAAIGTVADIVADDGGTADAATYMFTYSYWYANDSRMYCDSGILYKPGGRACNSGHLNVKYPGSSSYCYRRNVVTIWQGDNGWTSFTWNGTLYYVC